MLRTRRSDGGKAENVVLIQTSCGIRSEELWCLSVTRRTLASVDPIGHRGRMRERILADGGCSLTDCEVVEMLLCLSIPRRDTRPLAESLIKHFGSIEAVLAAEPAALHQAGVNWRAILPFRLTAIAAKRLARRELNPRPQVSSLSDLEQYLRSSFRPGTRILYMNNRNRLLGDQPITLDDREDQASIRAILRTALTLSATALLIADNARPPDRHVARATNRLCDDAARLSIVLHDRVNIEPTELTSYRRLGLL